MSNVCLLVSTLFATIMSGTQNHATRTHDHCCSESGSGKVGAFMPTGEHILAVSKVCGQDNCLHSMRGVLGFVVNVGVGPWLSNWQYWRDQIHGSGATRGSCPWISFFVMIVLLATPRAVVLSIWIGDWGCNHPISMRDW